MVDPMYRHFHSPAMYQAMLETEYRRPSLQSGDAATRTVGRTSAIMERHIDTFHPEVGDRTVAWYDMCCEYCGFDVRAELHQLYPEYVKAN